MSESNNTLRHSWLSGLLHEQRDRLSKLLRSLAGTGPVGNLPPSMFQRMIASLQQIADAKQDEAKLIDEIDALEDEHRRNRERKQLREAKPLDPAQPRPAHDVAPSEIPEPKRNGFGLLWLVALMAFIKSDKPEPKP